MIINIAGGSGEMGKAHRSVFERAGHQVIISGRTSNPGLEEAAEQSDLTIVSVPIPATREVVKKVAPYCSALMDFTGVKYYPVRWMLKHSNRNCEVAGLHPRYGLVSSIRGRTVSYCPTERTGEKCGEVIAALKQDGALVSEITPEEHDREVATTQVARKMLLDAFGLMIARTARRMNVSLRDLYESSFPPTRILIELIARQDKSQKNDEMYQAMRQYNPFVRQVRKELYHDISTASGHLLTTPRIIREALGDKFLAYLTNEAAKRI